MKKAEEIFSNILTKCMNPAAVSHVLINIEHRFTSLMELLWGVKKKKKVMYTDIYHSFLLCTCIKLYILDWKILMMISEQNQAP